MRRQWIQWAILTAAATASVTSSALENYQSIYPRECLSKLGVTTIAIRRWNEGEAVKYLVVDPETNVTRILDASDAGVCAPLAEGSKAATSPYQIAVNHYTKNPSELIDADHGFKTFSPACMKAENRPFAITIDMCPSTHIYESGFYKELAARACDFANGTAHRRSTAPPTPIAISIAGKWIKHHERQLEEIKALEKAGCLDITWVNHSYAHPYNPELRDHDELNFFIPYKLKDFVADLMRNEQYLIEHGVAPSIFYRFPGLMSKEDQIHALKNLGLVPLGTSAWITLNGGDKQYERYGMPKDQKAKPGRVGLFHGNGKMPIDITNARKYVLKSDFTLVSLPQALICGE
jgi:hypothetical protein